MAATTRPAAAAVTLVTAILLAGCGGSGSTSRPSAPAPRAQPAPGWALPGADRRNTRYVASAINGSDVSRLGVAWTVPITPSPGTAGAYATTPVIRNGVVYTQDLQSNVLAIRLATGQVLWRHDYHSPNGAATGAVLLKTPMSAGTNAPVAIDGDYVIAGAGAPLSPSQESLIIAYKLGARGHLPDTVGG